jgi:two-component system sensor histidine kinase TctE
MLSVLLAGAVTSYWIAWRSATKAYDRALFDTTLAIAEQLRVVDNKPQLPLTPQARAVLLTDKFDRIFYAVRGHSGELLDGDPSLPLPPDEELPPLSREGRYYFDSKTNSDPIRVAAFRIELADQPITILAGETLIKRNALIVEIIAGMLLPELVLILICMAIVWFGVRTGLKPLDKLRDELADRSTADLSPLQVGVPEEIQPVVVEMNQLLERLNHSLNSQRNFVSDAAHQLRTPMAALQAQVEASLREAMPQHRPELQGILGATQRLSHLVTQMLALARAEPSLEQTKTEVELSQLIGQLAERWLPQAIDKEIDLGFELAPALLRGNPLLLEELLANLLDNALRHAPVGGTVTVSCGKDGQFAWLAVEDDGPGAKESEYARLFERFYQAPGSHSPGNGLGLAIVREISRQHGGEVAAERASKLGGLRVVARFPAARNHATHAAARSPQDPH